MGELFGSIYCWLEDFFGLELADYLWGQSSPEQQSNMYIGIGLSMMAHLCRIERSYQLCCRLAVGSKRLL